MSKQDLLDYLAKRLQESNAELGAFKTAMAEHGLRLYARDSSGETDVTDRELKAAEAACEEYRALLREWSAKE